MIHICTDEQLCDCAGLLVNVLADYTPDTEHDEPGQELAA